MRMLPSSAAPVAPGPDATTVPLTVTDEAAQAVPGTSTAPAGTTGTEPAAAPAAAPAGAPGDAPPPPYPPPPPFQAPTHQPAHQPPPITPRGPLASRRNYAGYSTKD